MNALPGGCRSDFETETRAGRTGILLQAGSQGARQAAMETIASRSLFGFRNRNKAPAQFCRMPIPSLVRIMRTTFSPSSFVWDVSRWVAIRRLAGDLEME